MTLRLGMLLCVLGVRMAIGGEFVTESAREIPVAYNVDVVVVGGSTGAVAAATAAAKEGATVFLAAPHPYLGDDMTATLRLWLEEGETPTTPLAQKLFADAHTPPPIPDADRMLPLTYRADKPSGPVHGDTRRPSLLTDGKWGTAVTESVQYMGDAVVTADLGKAHDLANAYLLLYHHKDYTVARGAVEASSDGKTWRNVATVPCEHPGLNADDVAALVLATPVKGKARYVRFSVKRAEGMTRVLLAEILVTGVGPARPAPRRDPALPPPARPLHIKRVLDDELLAAGVAFLYSCYPTDVLRDADGKPAGIVMANRAGRQAVVAKAIIDATPRALIARMAGAKAKPFPGGTHEVRRVVIGGEPRQADGMTARLIEPAFRRGSKRFPVIDYTLQLPLADAGFAAWAKADQLARDRTYHEGQQFTSDQLFLVPPDPVQGDGKGELGMCRPAGVPGVYVLGGAADVPRERAAKLVRPDALIALGTRVGEAAAKDAKARAKLQGVTLAGDKRPAAARGDVREFLSGVRAFQELPTVPQAERSVPVLGRYDVVVIGGGTGGAPAGIAAARQGAKTLVVEMLHGLGGVGTLGAISSYYWGNRVGFTKEVAPQTRWSIEQKMELWRTKLREAGADIWFGAIGCGAFVEAGKVRGAVVVTPFGRGVVLAKAVIDSTGNSDIAAAAGADVRYTDGSFIALQGTGLPPRRLGASYTNTDFTIVDETDLLDVWHVMLYAKKKAGNAFDLGQLIDTRERRRIVGDATISILDAVNQRTYPDTICEAYTNFDTHGYTVHPFFMLEMPHKRGIRTNIPYRALLPKGLDGILVTGLGISMHRDAVPLCRMQPDIQNQGYAAGVAAAMAAAADCPTRKIDVKALQSHLVQTGNLRDQTPETGDSYPMPNERIAQAVVAVRENFKDAAVVLANADRALPLLRKAYEAADADKDKLLYARILAILGDATGVPTLIAAVEAAPDLGKGWRYKGMGQFGRNMSDVDALMYALGRTRDKRAVPCILKKLALLKPDSAFSHFRAFACALESIGDRSAAEPLARLLATEGIRGQAIGTVERVNERVEKFKSWTANQPRAIALRELMLARALYRLGDHDGLGKTVLGEYVADYRGHLARHAAAVLQSNQK